MILMGIDFSAILDLSLSWPDLPKVPARLDKVTPDLCAIWAEPASRQPRWSLELREWVYYVDGGPPLDEDEDVACRLHPGLDGPLHFHVVPHCGFAIVGHLARWKSFLQDLAVRERLRRSCKVIARALAASRVAYVADLALEELAEHRLYGEPYERVLASLHQWWGDACSLTSTYPIGERYFLESG